MASTVEIILKILESRSLRCRCTRLCFFQALSLWLCRWWPSLSSHSLSSLCACIIVSSYKDKSHFGLEYTIVDSFLPSFFFKDLISTYSHILSNRVLLTLQWEFGRGIIQPTISLFSSARKDCTQDLLIFSSLFTLASSQWHTTCNTTPNIQIVT